MDSEQPAAAERAPEHDVRPERHSRHPIAVLLPLGAWGASLGFDLLSHYGAPGNRFARLSRDVMLIGVAGASLAGALGLRDLIRFSPSRRPGPLGLFHAGLNLGAVAFYGAASLRRGAAASEGNIEGYDNSDARPDGRVTLGEALINAGALGVLALSGAIGGLLAQRFDVRPG